LLSVRVKDNQRYLVSEQALVNTQRSGYRCPLAYDDKYISKQDYRPQVIRQDNL